MPQTETTPLSEADGAQPVLACRLLAHCTARDVSTLLRRAGMRLTRQRIALGRLLYASGDRHLTAEMLYEEARRARIPVSLATVYNSLHQFAEAGLLRELPVDGPRMWFDTNTREHHHFLIEDENRLVDIPRDGVSIAHVADVPDDMEIERVEVVIRLRRKTPA